MPKTIKEIKENRTKHNEESLHPETPCARIESVCCCLRRVLHATASTDDAGADETGMLADVACTSWMLALRCHLRLASDVKTQIHDLDHATIETDAWFV